LRIISGKYKGRKLNPPVNLPVRPTTDFAKTGLFNILSSRFKFENLECLDLYAGTGNISLELISRGVKSVVAVDKNSSCLRFISEVSGKLGITNLQTIKSEVIRFILNDDHSYDLIFADPPFDSADQQQIVDAVFERGLLRSNGYLIVEHASSDHLTGVHNFRFEKRYGHVAFSFFSTLDQDKKSH